MKRIMWILAVGCLLASTTVAFASPVAPFTPQRSACDRLSGKERSECLHEEAAALSKANKDRANAANGATAPPKSVTVPTLSSGSNALSDSRAIEVKTSAPVVSATTSSTGDAAPSVMTAEPLPHGSGPPFRPDFRGTVNYSGTYTGQVEVIQRIPADRHLSNISHTEPPTIVHTGKTENVGGEFSASLQVLGASLTLSYHSTGIVGSGRAYGGRNGDTCTLTDRNSRWTGHCGPDGFFLSVTTNAGNIPAMTFSLNAPNVSYPSATDQAGAQPDTDAAFGRLVAAGVNAAAKIYAEEEQRSNALAKEAIRKKTNVMSCLRSDSEETSHVEFGPVHDGLYTRNENHYVTDRHRVISNSCGFTIDLMKENERVMIVVPGNNRTDLSLDALTAKPHIY